MARHRVLFQAGGRSLLFGPPISTRELRNRLATHFLLVLLLALVTAGGLWVALSLPQGSL